MNSSALLLGIALMSAPAFVAAQDAPRVVIPVPDRDFDLTEVVVPWRVLSQAGYRVVFATEHGPDGPTPACDPRLIDHPLLKLLRLTARPANIALYRQLEQAPEFQRPIRWSEIDPAGCAGLVLPGGHWKRGMRQYLEATALQAKVREFFRLGRPVAAICHGPVLLARTIDPHSGQSVIHGRRVAALTERLEMSGFYLTRLALGDYYRTYDQTVEAEVSAAVGPEGRFERGPAPKLFYSPTSAGHVTIDGQLVTARWPGDAWTWAHAFLDLLRQQSPVDGSSPGLNGAVEGE